jgi:transcriptional regulator with XRE-family HTH domain
MYLNIKLQVFRLGFHQIDIAKALGIDESVLSKIIHGYREPSKTQRMQLARYLNAEESWLFEKYDRGGPHIKGAFRNSPSLDIHPDASRSFKRPPSSTAQAL